MRTGMRTDEFHFGYHAERTEDCPAGCPLPGAAAPYRGEGKAGPAPRWSALSPQDVAGISRMRMARGD